MLPTEADRLETIPFLDQLVHVLNRGFLMGAHSQVKLLAFGEYDELSQVECIHTLSEDFTLWAALSVVVQKAATVLKSVTFGGYFGESLHWG